MLRRVARVLLAATAFTSAARADPRDRLSLHADARFVTGVSDVSGLHLPHGGLGVEWALASTLSLRAQALALGAVGASSRGEAAPFGAGGELALRLHPFPRWAVRPYGFWSIGLLLFPRAPFLPGGDIYEGIISFGLGAEVSLSDRWTLALDARYAHLSNGQGLGPHNPAFDGYGASLSARYALAPRHDIPGPWEGVPPPTEGRTISTPGGTLDLGVGKTGDALLLTARLRVAQRIVPRLVAVLDLESGALASEPLNEVGLGLVGHLGVASFAAHVGHRWYVGLTIPTAVVQAEWHATDEVSLVAMGQWEGASLGDDTWRAAVGVRAFPFQSLAVDLGVAFDRIGQPGFGGDTSDPYISVEWQLPIPLPAWQFSLFLDRQANTVDTGGVRVSYAMGRTLRDIARATGWRRLR
ncbi:MAG: hypothetical protein R3A52_19335 [Polyangiales bacterium]